jgi:hypothetical protein
LNESTGVGKRNCDVLELDDVGVSIREPVG